MASWHNWARTASASPRLEISAASVDAVQQAVIEAARSGHQVKVAGSGHSFSAIGQPVDVLLEMRRLNRLRSVDEHSRRVWVEAGITIAELSQALWACGLALPNVGDINVQTISGAISTGTHGTGVRLGGLAAAVTGIEMVLADGSLLRADDDNQPDLVPALAVGLGALGVVTAYQLQCVPRFVLAAREAPMRLDEVIDGLDEHVDGNDHFELYWFPYTDRALTKTNTRSEDAAGLKPLPRWRAVLDDEILSNGVLELGCRVASARPSVTRRFNALASRALGAREYADWSPAVFSSRRAVRFRECEWAVPRAVVPEIIGELRAYFGRTDEQVPFPIEVRFAAADDRWMSTAYGRESGYIAVHQYHRVPHQRYFADVTAIMNDYDARPHWGKMHPLGAAELRPRYEHFDDFVALRERLDPQRMFGNDYLQRVLGS